MNASLTYPYWIIFTSAVLNSDSFVVRNLVFRLGYLVLLVFIFQDWNSKMIARKITVSWCRNMTTIKKLQHIFNFISFPMEFYIMMISCDLRIGFSFTTLHFYTCLWASSCQYSCSWWGFEFWRTGWPNASLCSWEGMTVNPSSDIVIFGITVGDLEAYLKLFRETP